MNGWTVGQDEFTRAIGPLELRVYPVGVSWIFEVRRDGALEYGDGADTASDARAEAIECALAWAQEHGDETLVRELSDALPVRRCA